MKNYFHILTFCLLSSNGIAQNDLRLYSADGSGFIVFLKDSAVTKIPESNVLIQHIRTDTVILKVGPDQRSLREIHLFLLEKGKKTKEKEFNYKLTTNKDGLKVTFEGTYSVTSLPVPLVPRKPVIDTNIKFRNAVFGHLFEMKNGQPVYFNNIPEDKNCVKAMPDEYLGYMKILMSKADVADEKIKIAENVTRNNCLNVTQLNTIASYIEFEIDRLKIIRSAFFHLADTSGKKQLEKNFAFESSINELRSLFKNSDDYKPKKEKDCKTASGAALISNLVSEISIAPNDHRRLEILRNSYQELCFEVPQVKQLLSKFVHDREKLEVAKLLYLNCLDKSNFLSVASEFSYTHAEAELKEFIERQSR